MDLAEAKQKIVDRLTCISAERDVLQMALDILDDKFSVQFIDMQPLIDDNASKGTTISTLTSEKQALETEKTGLLNTIDQKNAKIAELESKIPPEEQI